MKKTSAGILLYRFNEGKIQFFLLHPGGPFYFKKDLGAWTIPKGEPDENEDLFLAAKREFLEETGQKLEVEKSIELKQSKTKSGKIIHAWAVEGKIDHLSIRSNSFSVEWPPRSGKHQEFPEMDRAEWFDTDTAKAKIHDSQRTFIDQLLNILKHKV